jgi:hypothetical protein
MLHRISRGCEKANHVHVIISAPFLSRSFMRKIISEKGIEVVRARKLGFPEEP